MYDKTYYNKKKLKKRRHGQLGDTFLAQWESRHLQAKGGPAGKTEPASTLSLDFHPPDLGEGKFLLFKKQQKLFKLTCLSLQVCGILLWQPWQTNTWRVLQPDHTFTKNLFVTLSWIPYQSHIVPTWLTLFW